MFPCCLPVDKSPAAAAGGKAGQKPMSKQDALEHIRHLKEVLQEAKAVMEPGAQGQTSRSMWLLQEQIRQVDRKLKGE